MAARKRTVATRDDFADALAEQVAAEKTAEADAEIARTPFVQWVEKRGQRLEPGQRALARVLFDKADPDDLEDPEERARALRMFGCGRIPEQARTLGINLAVCGGRGGKSLLAAWRLVYLAATLPIVLSPGEQAFAIIVAPDLRLAEQTLRYCIGIAQEWFPEKGRVCEESSLGFTLVRAQAGAEGDKWADERVRFAILPASKGGSAQRGRALVGAILDEAAFFRGDDSAVNDRDVLDAITPRVIQGGEVIITTTPWARNGEVYALFDRNWSHPVDAVVAHAPTWELRTDERILAQVEREKTRDPWNYAREFGAQFVERDQGTFFEADALSACTSEAAA